MAIFNFPPERPPSRVEQDREDLAYCAKHSQHINNWERDFIIGASGYAVLSQNQRDKLALIMTKIRTALAIEGECC